VAEPVAKPSSKGMDNYCLPGGTGLAILLTLERLLHPQDHQC